MICRSFVFYLGFSLLIGGCGPKVDPAIIDAAVLQNVAQYRASKIKNCRENQIFSANIIVDSLMRAYSRAAIVSQDTLLPPERPIRPEQQQHKSPLDTMRVKPLFENN